MVKVSFWGVRGSTPCACEANRRYGGNTACVSVEAAGQNPIVLDLGTGLRFFGDTCPPGEPLNVLALVSHLHWDHVQGLPFFGPVHSADTTLTIWGRADGCTIQDAFEEFMRPPFFPVRPCDLFGKIEFADLVNSEVDWGRARITARDVPHTGDTNGYRVDLDGVSIAYVSDHQQPVDGTSIAPGVLELCADADLVIHDAQYEPHEFAMKSDWGHCTVAYAVRVAAQAGARRLALFHHDPSHGDDVIDRLLAEARSLAEGTSIIEVVAASEGLCIELSAAQVAATAD